MERSIKFYYYIKIFIIHYLKNISNYYCHLLLYLLLTLLLFSLLDNS